MKQCIKFTDRNNISCSLPVRSSEMSQDHGFKSRVNLRDQRSSEGKIIDAGWEKYLFTG